MPYFLVICVTVVIAILGLWFAASGVEPNFILGQFASFTPRDKAFAVLVAGFLLFILGYAIWQSQAVARQRTAVPLLKGPLDGVRQGVAAVDLEQRSHDA